MKQNTVVFLIYFFFLFSFSSVLGQEKVGLVLSGGGVTGMAHIGVIKALEENDIPIDYITGTSAGAFIGAMYACGYSAKEIEEFVLSDDYQKQAMGILKDEQRFFFRETNKNSSLLSLEFSKDSLFFRSLPLNVVSSALLDYSLMNYFGLINANLSMDKSFDSLFVPFRCIASDVAFKKAVTFKKGDLNKAVRASMTYPFYLKPINIDGTLFYDGGLYNNFPSDIMYNDFNPDYIIGSNVSSNSPPPDENDLIGIVTNMLVSHSSYNLPCKEGIMIEPKVNVKTFDFEKVKMAIDEGYRETIKKMDSIKNYLNSRTTKKELFNSRKQFRKKIKDLKISSISHNFYEKKHIDFVKYSLKKKKRKSYMNEKELNKKYYRLYASPHIDFLFPSLTMKEDSTFNLDVYTQKAKEFRIDIGGHISSRPINTGYVSFQYRNIGKIGSIFHAETYFGKFYGSLKLNYTADFPFQYPFSITPYFVLNRWDYFRSFSTFFEDVQPSFLVQNELYFGVKLSHPIGNNTKSTFDLRSFDLDDRYFQNENFTNIDTTDKTNFIGGTASLDINYNTLNRKQFANAGSFFRLKIRYVSGQEYTIPGSTSAFEDTIIKKHRWLSFHADIQSYLLKKKKFQIGTKLLSTFNTQSLFSNYTASLLSMPSFSINPDLKTFFLPEYRSPQHVGGGLDLIYNIKKNLELRLETYFYQPFLLLTKNEDGTHQYTEPFKGSAWLSAFSFIFHTPVGPIRTTLNWLPKQKSPFIFQFSYGYTIFNERAIR